MERSKNIFLSRSTFPFESFDKFTNLRVVFNFSAPKSILVPMVLLFTLVIGLFSLLFWLLLSYFWSTSHLLHQMIERSPPTFIPYLPTIDLLAKPIPLLLHPKPWLTGWNKYCSTVNANAGLDGLICASYTQAPEPGLLAIILGHDFAVRRKGCSGTGVGARPVDGMCLRLGCQKTDLICTGYCAAEWVSYYVQYQGPLI